MRVASLDMTDPTHNCPNGFRLVTIELSHHCVLVVDLSRYYLAVHQPCIQYMELSTHMCVDESLDTKIELLMLLHHIFSIFLERLTLFMLKELVSLTGSLLVSTSGHLLLLLMKLLQT